MAPLSIEDVIPLRLADVTFPTWHPLTGQAGEVFAFAVRHPSGLLLYETGIGRGNEFIERQYQVAHRSIEDELEAHGHRIEDIRLIVNSHLHFDHCGNNSKFPGVPIYVQEAEYQAAREPNYTVREWVEFEGAELVLIEGDRQVADGVRVMSTPGHTLGHQSLILETRAGQVALAGQAIYSKAEYEQVLASGTAPSDDPPPDPTAYLESALRLIDLESCRVYFSHDRSIWTSS